MSQYTRYPPINQGTPGSGTVTSVGLLAPAIFTVTGSPVTTSGDLALSLADQSGNTVLASPADGSLGTPTFRTLLPADIPGGASTPNTFAGYDNAGALGTIPNWNINTSFTPSRFGLNAFFNIDPFLAGGYSVTNNIFSNLTPTADAPTDSEVLLQLSTAIDPTNTGFGIGAPTGLASRILDLSLTAPTSGANGQIQVFNIDTNVGDGVITGGSANSLIPINLFTQVQQGFTVGAIGGVGSALNTSVGSSVDNISGYSANIQVNGSLSNYLGYYQAFGNISNTNASNANVRSFDSALQINGQLGDVTIHSDFNTILASANITAEYNSIGLNPSAVAGAVIRSYTGINLSPNFSTATITDDLAGMRINLQNITAGTNLVGLDVNVQGSVDSNPQGITGISTNGKLSVNAETQLVSGQTFQIGNRVESLLHVHPGFPVTGTDSIGNDLAGDLLAEDDVALGPFGIGWISNGVIADMAVATGKTVDTISVLVPAVALPDPGFPTGGHVNNLAFVRAFAPLTQGGTITVDNLYTFKLDPVFGNIGAAATNAWGVWIGDTTADNWFAKNVIIGGVTGKPTGAFALDITGNTKSTGDIASATLTPANGASGTFTTIDLKTVTVVNGIITSIV